MKPPLQSLQSYHTDYGPSFVSRKESVPGALRRRNTAISGFSSPTFFILVKWAGKAVLQAENETGEFSFAGLHGGMEWPPACALVRFCGSGFATLLVGGTQCFSEQHAIDVAETVERAVHSASEFLVRDGLIVDLGRKSTFA